MRARQRRPARGLLVTLVMATLCVKTGFASADTLAVIDGNSRIEADPHSEAGLFSWEVDGTNHLFQEWFWGRSAESDAFSLDSTLPLLHHELHGTNQIHLLYGGAGSGSAEIFYSLLGGEAGSGVSTINEQIRVSNFTDEEFGPFSLFAYSDFDVNGSPDGDLAEFFAPNAITQRDGDTVITVTSLSPTPSQWGIAPFPDILTQLSDGSLTDLGNATSPLGPDDLAHAFQYDFDGLAAGSSIDIHLQKRVEVLGGNAGDPVAPEPATLFLWGLGGLGVLGRAVFATNRRKRT